MMAKTSTSNSRAEVAEKLKVVLASSYTLMLKTQNYHWNVTGPTFTSLHDLFGQQYEEMFAANDEIAERIRALGQVSPGSLAAFARLSEIADAPADPPPHAQMIADLLKDNETMSRLASDLRAFADDAGDTATGDMMNGRIDAHDKAGWMLRAHLG